MPDTTYRPATWFKIMCWVLAVICAIFIVLLPGTIAMIWLALKAQVVVREDRIEVTWFKTRSIPWSSIKAMQWARAAGVIGVAMRPLSYQVEGQRGWGNIAVGAFEKNGEIIQALTKKTGLSL